MSRTRIVVDSATPQQVYNLTLAFQRTLGYPLPKQLTTEPTVTVGGTAMGWTSPALTSDHALALLKEYEELEIESIARAKVRQCSACGKFFDDANEECPAGANPLSDDPHFHTPTT